MKGHARNLMTDRVVSVNADTPIAEIGRLLVDAHFRGVPVVDDERHVLGFVSETDLLAAFLRHAPAETTAREVMTAPPIVVDEFMSTDEVLNVLRQARIHHLPVVRGGKLVGLITPYDILKYVVERDFPIPPEDA